MIAIVRIAMAIATGPIVRAIVTIVVTIIAMGGAMAAARGAMMIDAATTAIRAITSAGIATAGASIAATTGMITGVHTGTSSTWGAIILPIGITDTAGSVLASISTTCFSAAAIGLTNPRIIAYPTFTVPIAGYAITTTHCW